MPHLLAICTWDCSESAIAFAIFPTSTVIILSPISYWHFSRIKPKGRDTIDTSPYANLAATMNTMQSAFKQFPCTAAIVSPAVQSLRDVCAKISSPISIPSEVYEQTFAPFRKAFDGLSLSKRLAESYSSAIAECMNQFAGILVAYDTYGERIKDEEVTLPDSFYETVEPVVKVLTEEPNTSIPLSSAQTNAISTLKDKVKHLKEKVSTDAFRFWFGPLFGALVSIACCVYGQLAPNPTLEHISQQLDRQVAISEAQLEQSELKNDFLEDGVTFLQSINDSLHQLLEAKNIPVQDVDPSNKIHDRHPE